MSEYRQFYKVADVGIAALKSQDYKQASRVFEQARALYKNDPYINYYAGLSVFQ